MGSAYSMTPRRGNNVFLLTGLAHNPDTQLPQLFRGHLGRGVGHEARSLLCLGKRDYIADRLPLEEEHHNPIQTEGNSSMGRRTELQRIQEETEFHPRIIMG